MAGSNGHEPKDQSVLLHRYINFDEFIQFEGILCQPDALYRLAFKIFDSKGTGRITFREYRLQALLLSRTKKLKVVPQPIVIPGSGCYC